MRVNIYAEEITDRIEVIEKETSEGVFTGLRFYLELPVTLRTDTGWLEGLNYRGPFMHSPGDDDSAAVTFWGKRELLPALKKAVEILETHYAKSRGGF